MEFAPGCVHSFRNVHFQPGMNSTEYYCVLLHVAETINMDLSESPAACYIRLMRAAVLWWCASAPPSAWASCNVGPGNLCTSCSQTRPTTCASCNVGYALQPVCLSPRTAHDVPSTAPLPLALLFRLPSRCTSLLDHFLGHLPRLDTATLGSVVSSPTSGTCLFTGTSNTGSGTGAGG
eukprot:gene4998-5114_t